MAASQPIAIPNGPADRRPSNPQDAEDEATNPITTMTSMRYMWEAAQYVALDSEAKVWLCNTLSSMPSLLSLQPQ